MALRLLILSGLLAAAVFAQEPVPVRAGDRAPEIDWSRIVRSPDGAKYQPSLAGVYTVLQFLPVTPNARAIDRWNELIAKFADKPVQFVWIANEARSAVEPFLREHPLNGWLLVDDKDEVARAYGCRLSGDNVIVDPSGKIVGFTPFLEPDHLAAVVDGKAVAIERGTDGEQVMKLLADGKVRIDSEPHRFDPPEMAVKPDIPPSYEVHISPSKSKSEDGSAGPDFWVQRGFDLKTMVATVYEKDQNRVVIPEALDGDDKFDFVVVLPHEEDEKTIHQLVQRAIEKYFSVSAVLENKPVDVYVMTAIEGKTPAAKTGPDSFGGSVSSGSSFGFKLPEGTAPTPEAVEKAMKEMMKHPENMGFSNIAAGNTTVGEFCEQLESGLGRPIVNETGLEGAYDLEVHGDAKNTAEFLQTLREQTGLVLTPATRSIEILTLRSLK